MMTVYKFWYNENLVVFINSEHINLKNKNDNEDLYIYIYEYIIFNFN